MRLLRFPEVVVGKLAAGLITSGQHQRAIWRMTVPMSAASNWNIPRRAMTFGGIYVFADGQPLGEA